jgi:hypothetical protein
MHRRLNNGFRLTLDSGGGQQPASQGIQGNDQIARLIDLIGNEQFSIRVAATRELIELGPQAVPALLTALQEGLWFTRECAAQALGQIGNSQAIDPLAGRLQDENIGVRCSAAQALSLMIERHGAAQVGGIIAQLGPGVATDAVKAIRKTSPLAGRRLDEYFGEHPDALPKEDRRQERERRQEKEKRQDSEDRPDTKDRASSEEDTFCEEAATSVRAEDGFRSLWDRFRRYLESRS